MHYESCPLGHAKLETTAYYTKVATRTVHSITSPLDKLLLGPPKGASLDG